MIRLAARQFRMQAVVAAAGLSAVAIVLAITGRDLIHLYDTSGIAACRNADVCGPVEARFVDHYQLIQRLGNLVLLLLPGVIGIFWGAPLVARELETGTFRLVWTQSISRTRWLAVKLALVGLAGLAVAGLFTQMLSWWFSPIDRTNMNAFNVFDTRGIVPVGYAGLAVALGVTTGLLIRRSLPAMAATLAGFSAVRIALTYWLRPELLAPVHLNLALGATSGQGFAINSQSNGSPSALTYVPGSPNLPNAWVYSTDVADRMGRVQSDQSLHHFLVSHCPHIVTQLGNGRGGPGDPATSQACLRTLSATFHEVVAYQPAARYWTFQWYETAIYLALALVLVGLCFWWLRRRLT